MLQSKTFAVPAPRSSVAAGKTAPDDNDIIELETRFIAPLEGQSNTVVLLLPYWGGSAATFEAVMSCIALHNPTATLLSISYAGTGSGPPPADDRAEAHSIVPRAEQIVSLLQTAEFKALCQTPVSQRLRLVLCAHSMSAKIAYVALNALAEKVEFDVGGLVLLGPAPVGPLVLPDGMREQQLHAYDNLDSAGWVVEHVLTEKELSVDVRERLAKDCAEMSSGAKSGWLMQGMSFDCAVYLRGIKQRWPELGVHVLVGGQDKVETVEKVKSGTMVPLQSNGFAAEIVEVHGCGHLLPVEAVDEVAEAVTKYL